MHVRPFFLATLLAMLLPAVASAQTQPVNAQVVTACGQPNSTYAVGSNQPVTQDPTGTLCTPAGGGGGGGAVTVANGADVAQGNTADAAYAGSGSATVVATLKGVYAELAAALTANISQFGGSNVVTGTGTGGAGIPRVTVSNDSTVGIVAGSAIIGKVGIDQTTPGTTNGVQVNAALPAGTNLIGKATINDGTNSAAVKAASTAAAASDPALVITQSPNSAVPAVTPAASTASAIVTGGSATTLITGPVKGCFVTNPLTASDQNIAAAEVAYVNIVTTATANGRGTNAALQPGQTFTCPPGMTTNLSAIAATTSHAFSVVVW